MEQPHNWLFDLSKAPPEPGGPAHQNAARTKEAKATPHDARRSPAQALAQLAFLKGFNHSQIQAILKICTVGSYESGEEVCAMDVPNDELYILIAGELAFFTKEEDQVLTLLPIATVGELCFMTNCQCPVGLRAAKASKVLRLSRSRFNSLPQDLQVKAYRNIIEILASRLAGCAETKCKKLARIWG